MTPDLKEILLWLGAAVLAIGILANAGEISEALRIYFDCWRVR